MSRKHSCKYFFKAHEIKKTAAMLVTIALLITVVPGLTAGADEGALDRIVETKQFTFGDIEFTPDNDNYVTITSEGAESSLMIPGEPNLPAMKSVFVLPLGAQDIEVEYTLEDATIETFEIDDIISPGPTPIPLVDEQEYKILGLLTNIYQRLQNSQQQLSKYETEIQSLDSGIYGSGKLYPDDNLQYEFGIGRYAGELHTLVPVTFCPVRYDGIDTIEQVTGEVTVTVSYVEDESLSLEYEEEVDFLIISASAYVKDLEPLVAHKEDMGFAVKLVTVDEVLDGTYFDVPDWCHDDQEVIKYFIYQAWNNWSVDYVMPVGGYRTFFGLNRPQFQFPIRYSHLEYGEPGYVCDNYYSCFLRYDDEEGYLFDTWDSNNNDRFAEWDAGGYDIIDPFADVYWGRLACRNRKEVRTMVDKIITYETTTYGSEWFDDMLTVTGDGFQDQQDLAIGWDTNGLPPGDYTIYAQSYNSGDLYGPIDEVKVTVNHAAKSRVTFAEEDHLKIQPLDYPDRTSEDFPDVYPAYPVAEITSPSDDDMLGKDDVGFVPPEAYMGGSWAAVDYTDGIMKIRGKSYDPVPHYVTWNGMEVWPARKVATTGATSTYKVWVNNSDDETVFTSTELPSQMFYEGELECWVGTHFMPDFEQTKLWTSNGNWWGMWNVIDEFSEGYGFVYFAGHSSPLAWGDHFPGIPGGRDDGQSNGIGCINLRYGLERYAAEEGEPLLPIDQLTNGYKLPVVVMGGCHSAAFDTSLMRLLLDPGDVLQGMGYGLWTPEGMAWWMTRVPQGGGIAFMGFAGLGFGYLGVNNPQGLSGWMDGEFFRNYGEQGIDILGRAFTEALNNYSVAFETVSEPGNRKTFEEFALLGDPTLKMGGYEPDTGALDEGTVYISEPVDHDDLGYAVTPTEAIRGDVDPLGDNGPLGVEDNFQVTTNELLDKSPSFISLPEEDSYLVGFAQEVPYYDESELEPGFAYSSGGAAWTTRMKGWPGDQEYVSVDHNGYYDNGAYATFGNQGTTVYCQVMSDMTNPDTWDYVMWADWIVLEVGKNGIEIVGTYPSETVWPEGLWLVGMITDIDYEGYETQVPAFFGPVPDQDGYGSIRWYPQQDNSKDICGGFDPSTLYAYFSWDSPGPGGYIASGIGNIDDFPGKLTQISGDFAHPDVDAGNGYAYMVYEQGDSIIGLVSSNNGQSWTGYTVTDDGTDPQVVVHDDDTVSCYFVYGEDVYVSTSSDYGITWDEPVLIVDCSIDDSVYRPFDVSTDGLIFTADDGDLYANLFVTSTAAIIGDIIETGSGVRSTIMNAGTTYLMDAKWDIAVEGTSPLGWWFQLEPGTFLYELLRGKIRSGGYTNDTVWLAPGRSEDISSSPTSGFGHVDVVIRVYDPHIPGEVIAEKTEDGFLLGSRLLLYHGEE